LQTREDGSYLFGFATKRERQLFRLLITVSGIGPRLALNVLSCLSVNEFAQAILIGDLKGLSRVSGIGKRSAERLVVELKERIQELDLGGEDLGAARSPSLSPEARDAVAALQTLGFKPETARKAVEKISADTAHSTEDYIVAALRDLNS
jgi:Holliday junction DNA helicase RuvA